MYYHFKFQIRIFDDCSKIKIIEISLLVIDKPYFRTHTVELFNKKKKNKQKNNNHNRILEIIKFKFRSICIKIECKLSPTINKIRTYKYT